MGVMLIPGVDAEMAPPAQRMHDCLKAKYVALLIDLALRDGAEEAARKGLFDRIERAIGLA